MILDDRSIPFLPHLLFNFISFSFLYIPFQSLFEQNKLSRVVRFFFFSLSLIYPSFITDISITIKKEKFKDTIKNIFDGKTRLKMIERDIKSSWYESKVLYKTLEKRMFRVMHYYPITDPQTAAPLG